MPENLTIAHPFLRKFYDEQIECFPRHKQFLDKNLSTFDTVELTRLEKLAEVLHEICGKNIHVYCESYRWFAREVMKETKYIHSYGKYRHNSAKEVYELIYSDDAYMERYNQGLLISSLWWKNHFKSLVVFEDRFLSLLRPNGRHLEVGPGHGIYLLSHLTKHADSKASAWDISKNSLLKTSECLSIFALDQQVDLVVQDLLVASTSNKYNSIVISEVLEHLDDPKYALTKLFSLLVPGGLIFINFPINSPAIDHVFNIPHPDAVVSLIRDCGFEVVESRFVPATNYGLEQAINDKLNINVLIIAKRN